MNPLFSDVRIPKPDPHRLAGRLVNVRPLNLPNDGILPSSRMGPEPSIT